MGSEVRRAAYQNQTEFDSGKRKLVGVNIFVEEDDVQMQALKILQKHNYSDPKNLVLEKMMAFRQDKYQKFYCPLQQSL